MIPPRYTTLILDLGDVLFTWSATTKTNISPRILKKLLSSSIWWEYECGRISEDVCYHRLGERFSLPPDEVTEAFSQARESLQSNDAMISLVHELKAASNGTLRVYAMSNISKEDYVFLSTRPADWSIFDQVFTSADAGMRKPDLGFYRHVLEATQTAPQNAVFVDDKFENVFAARSLGLHGIVFDNTANINRGLRNIFGDPVRRGKEFLSSNTNKLHSITENGIILRENFAQLLILNVTGDQYGVCNLRCFSPSSSMYKEYSRNPALSQDLEFFHGSLPPLPKTEILSRLTVQQTGKPVLTTETYPDDLDTTALALMTVKCEKGVITSVLDEMLEYVNEDGIVLTYFDKTRPRVDPVVCVNVLALFYQHGRGHQLQRTLQWVHEVLLHRAYSNGTRYYPSPECFLFSVGRLLGCSHDRELHNKLGPLLKKRVAERIGADGDALTLAMRILTCKAVNLEDDVDLLTLLTSQCEDGGWELGWVYSYGASGTRIGNRGVPTALAINAIEAFVWTHRGLCDDLGSGSITHD